MRAVRGWFRAIEITRNRKTGEYHPHIHAVLMVEDDYFVVHANKADDTYIDKDTWIRYWRESLKVDYDPSVSISKTKAKGKKDSAKAAAVEAAKYCVKGSEFLKKGMPIQMAAEIAETYTKALAGKRLTGLGGWLLDASRELNVELEDDGDLVHDEDCNGSLTEATAELLEEYGWRRSVEDHILISRRKNPNYKGQASVGDEPGSNQYYDREEDPFV